MHSPKRNLPLTILIGIPLVTVLYVLTNVSYLTLLPAETIASSKAVAIAWAEQLLPDDESGPSALRLAVPFIVAFFVSVSTFGAANGTLFTAGRRVNKK